MYNKQKNGTKKFKIAWLLPIREQYIFINMFGTHYLLIAIAIAIVTAFTMVQNISTKKTSFYC